MKPFALAAAICALAGCAVPMQTVDASRVVCASYGFQPGSDAFAECVTTEQHRHTLVIYGGGAGGPDVTAPPLVPDPLGIGSGGGAWSGVGPGWAASGVGGSP
jgi:hypothetical protein